MRVRINNLTGVRAVAALWVVLHHVNMLQTNVQLNLGRVVSHGEFGVDLFFVLSGFVLTLVYADKLPARFAWGDYRQFLVRRLAKIYPVHLLTLLMMIALMKSAEALHYNFTAETDNTAWTAWCSLLMLHATGLTKDLSWNRGSWSVGAEWFAYAALFTPMVYLLRRVRTTAIAVAATTLLIVMALLSIKLGRPWTTLTSTGVLRILPDFLCGYLLCRMLKGGTARHGEITSATGAAMVLLACYLPYGSLWLLVPGIMTLLAGLYAGGPLVDRVFGNRVLVSLGDSSYSIYLLHGFVLIGAKQVILRMHVQDSASARYALTVAALCGASFAGVVCYQYVEEPLRRAVLSRFGQSGNYGRRLPKGDGTPQEENEQVAATIS